MTVKYHIVSGDMSYSQPFNKLRYNHTNDLKSAELLVFTGGTDISPKLYGDSPIAETDFPDRERDVYESNIFQYARDHGVPMVGICRGSQFLCAMSHGRVIQHVNYHAIRGTHTICTDELGVIEVTSTHHQMMYPFEVNHTLLAWAAPALSTVYKTGGFDPDLMSVEPEVVYFPDTNCLSVQYHPEYMSSNSDGYIYFQELVQKLVSKQL